MKPEPKPTSVVCTACGLDWQKHLAGPRKKNPTLEDCVRVLKAELAARPRSYAWSFPQSGVNATAQNVSYGGIPLLGNQIGKAQ